MVDKFAEPRHPGEFIVTEASGTRSREQGVLASGNNLVPGAVVGQITADSKYTELDPDASDGSEVVAGVLYAAVDASSADADGVFIVRDCEVMTSALVLPDGITTPETLQAIAEMKALGIITR